jgi:ribosomal protein S18 acetylase RimI-like enzyme
MSLRLPSFLNRIAWALRKRLAGRADRRHILFRHDGSDLASDPAVQMIAAPVAVAQCPGIAALADVGVLKRELAHGARLSFIAEDGATLCYALHAHIDDWFVPTAPNDEIVYSVVTSRQAMGRGLAPRLSRAIAHDVHERGGSAWVDCVKWNTRAHRAFEKAGFVRYGSEDYPARANSAAD